MLKKKATLCLFLHLCLLLVFTGLPQLHAEADFPWLPETYGEAFHLQQGYMCVTGIGLTHNAPDDVVMFTENAPVYDLRTGAPMRVTDIRNGDIVRAVYYWDGLTDEADAVFRAAALYVHADATNAADFRTIVSENIFYGEDGCIFVTHDGKYRVVVTADTLLTDGGGSVFTPWDIVPGMDMFVWAAFVTASFPGQLIPDKMVLVGYME